MKSWGWNLEKIWKRRERRWRTRSRYDSSSGLVLRTLPEGACSKMPSSRCTHIGGRGAWGGVAWRVWYVVACIQTICGGCARWSAVVVGRLLVRLCCGGGVVGLRNLEGMQHEPQQLRLRLDPREGNSELPRLRPDHARGDWVEPAVWVHYRLAATRAVTESPAHVNQYTSTSTVTMEMHHMTRMGQAEAVVPMALQ